MRAGAPSARCGWAPPTCFTAPRPPHILNFPPKGHWRSASRVDDIVAGLECLARHSQSWGITSLAVPALGCGLGRLNWRVVGPILARSLDRLDIPVELYAPFGTPPEALDPTFLLGATGGASTPRLPES